MTITRTSGSARALAAAIVLLSACGPYGPPQLLVQSAPQRGVSDPARASAIAVAESLAAPLTIESPAISVAVAVGDSIVWSAAFGFSDLEARTLATVQSRFRIYSLSKGLTATTVMQLSGQGKLALDVPVARYLPGESDRGITTRQLLGHLGGVRHYQGKEAILTRNCDQPKDALGIFGGDALAATPGTAYLYSSWGYAMASAG